MHDHTWLSYNRATPSCINEKLCGIALHSQKHTSCNKSVGIWQQLVTTSRYQDAFAWLATACWRQVSCKLSTGGLQADSTSYNKPGNIANTSLIITGLLQRNQVDKFIATSQFRQQVGKIDLLAWHWQLATSLWRFWLHCNTILISFFLVYSILIG